VPHPNFAFEVRVGISPNGYRARPAGSKLQSFSLRPSRPFFANFAVTSFSCCLSALKTEALTRRSQREPEDREEKQLLRNREMELSWQLNY
jgi:hypothetical protein